jgi:hypothetical protein
MLQMVQEGQGEARYVILSCVQWLLKGMRPVVDHEQRRKV